MNEELKILDTLNEIVNEIPEAELALVDRSDIQLSENKNNSYSYRAYENILIKITYQVNSKFIELRKAEGIDEDILREKFNNVKNDENSLYYKINVLGVEDIKRLSNEIKLAYKYLNKIEPVISFGCCSRYIECSDKKECVNTIRELRKGCIYKRNLEEGKIFYGKNANNK